MHQAAKFAIASKSLATILASRRFWYDELGQSVLKNLQIPLSDAERKRISEEDVARVLVACESSPFAQRDRTVLYLFAGNGPREKELVSLLLRHYDRIEGTITIPATGTKGRRGFRKSRTLFLDDLVRAELNLYIDEHRVGVDHPDAPLFTTRSGTVFTENGIYQIFSRLKEATGIDALCPHALRHYWAERFDGDLLELKREGGWNSWKLVERTASRPDRPAAKAPLRARSEKRRGRRFQGEGPQAYIRSSHAHR